MNDIVINVPQTIFEDGVVRNYVKDISVMTTEMQIYNLKIEMKRRWEKFKRADRNIDISNERFIDFKYEFNALNILNEQIAIRIEIFAGDVRYEFCPRCNKGYIKKGTDFCLCHSGFQHFHEYIF